VTEFQHGEVTVRVYPDSAALAAAAATDAAAEMVSALGSSTEANVIFAGAESQMEFHRHLAGHAEVDWSRVNAFAVDDFWCPGIPPEYRVAAQPRRDLYSRVRPRSVNVIDTDADDPEAEAARYERLLGEHPVHLACVGIGVSGHLALCEPGETDFRDARKVRPVSICRASREQLERDPNFKALERIPERGITCTVPALLGAGRVLVIVPYAAKAGAIRRFFTSPVSEDMPATVLKTKPGTLLYLDADSFGQSRDLQLQERRSGARA
jgi:glucosamine-6-phosphate deaminase